eukprot:IDg11143t1
MGVSFTPALILIVHKMPLLFTSPTVLLTTHVKVTHKCKCSVAGRNPAAVSAARGPRRSRSDDSRRAMPGFTPNGPGRGAAIQATWNGRVLARSSEYVYLEGRFYFPRDSVDWGLFTEAGVQGHRNPYGRIDFYDVRVDKHLNRKAAWRFDDLRKPYTRLSGFTAFWKGVEISQAPVSTTMPCALEDIDRN